VGLFYSHGTQLTSRRRTDRARGAWRILGFYLRHLILWLLLAIAAYGIWLDRVVGDSFASRSWSLPTRVYASPFELYAGLRTTQEELQVRLTQLGYTRVSNVSKAGQYSLPNNSVEVFTRGYHYPDSRDQPRRLKIQFAGPSVATITDVSTGSAARIARLEPLEIGGVHKTSFEDRLIVTVASTPQLFIETLVAVEDRRFYSHVGIDPIGIVRALANNIFAGSIKQGGSTITQQLIKNLYLSNERSYLRKLREALMAISLERRHSKEEIIEAYMNEIFLGQDGNRAIHGFGLGARFLFGKDLADLSIAESSMLVGMVRAPSAYNPKRRLEAAIRRRNSVLQLLLQQRVISAEEFDDAVKEKVLLADNRGFREQNVTSFIELVRDQLVRDYPDAMLQTAGLNIYTTLDPYVQTVAQTIAAKGLREIEKGRSPTSEPLQTAVVIADPRTAEIKGLVGSRNHSSSGFNRALNARRPIGSLLKPFIYLTALEQTTRFNVLSRIDDAPITLVAKTGTTWSPRNYDGKSRGPMALRDAIAQSNNLATVNLGLSIGLKKIIERMKSLGFSQNIIELPSLLLGAVDLTPLEVTSLYQGIANDGFHVPLRAIRTVSDDQNRMLTRYPPSVTQVAEPEIAHLTQYLLSGVVERGTARSATVQLASSLPLAGKTGTTNDGRDSWFAGFGENYLTVVWVGRDDNGQTGLTGSSGALKLWTGIMKRIGIRPLKFGNSDNLEWAWVSEAGDAVFRAACPGTIRVPLALPHGLPVMENCVESELPVAEPNVPVTDPKLWEKFRQLFH
jgi:penicillin-binding protein 1B